MIANLVEFQQHLVWEGMPVAIGNLEPPTLAAAITCLRTVGRDDLANILAKAADLRNSSVASGFSHERLMALESNWDSAVEDRDLDGSLKSYILDNFNDIFDGVEQQVK